MWFERLTGFREENPSQVRSQLKVVGKTLTSLVTGQSFQCGRLETPSLGELRQQLKSAGPMPTGPLQVSEVVADVQQLHRDSALAGAVFQVASQFNLLEMVSPEVTPEQGIDRYEHDRTQGPACAIACGAGTIYRNYFAEVNGRVGQSHDNQIDCLADLGQLLGNEEARLWRMQNGYVQPTAVGLREVALHLASATKADRDHLRRELRVGNQWETEVTLPGAQHLVTQVYCSALPVAYSSFPADEWERFACLVLEAAYEATLTVAALNLLEHGQPKVFLTLLGGGAFGNREGWILEAIERALRHFQQVPLQVAVVSYRRLNPQVQRFLQAFQQQHHQL